jgi:hypothetical protein
MTLTSRPLVLLDIPLSVSLAVLVAGRAAARPLSRRPTGARQFRTCLASLMVTDIGDDARWTVSAADVGTVLGTAHTAGFDRGWIAGGWGVDALVGRQTRIHSDVDVTQMALDHLLQAFGRHGYGVEADWRPESRCTRCGRLTPGRSSSNRFGGPRRRMKPLWSSRRLSLG